MDFNSPGSLAPTRRMFGMPRLLPLIFGIATLIFAAPALAAAPPVFEKSVLPLLKARWRCHGVEKRSADLDVRTKSALLKGGETGPAVVPGSPEQSLLWVKIAGDKMPPGKAKLSQAEKTTVRAWIDGGARDDGSGAAGSELGLEKQVTDADRQFWSFRPPVRPAVPRVKAAGRVRNPIDAFVLAALQKQGLTLAPEADRLTLLRRVTFDLTGLPPTPQETAAFLADEAPDAYEHLVDRLLASAAVWRALGTALARPGRLRRFRGHPRRRLCPHRRLALSRLRHPRLQQRQALRPLPPGADRRRRADRLLDGLRNRPGVAARTWSRG